MKAKHQRLLLIGAALVAALLAALLAIWALRDEAAYFFTPAEAKAARVAPGRDIRLGGMVVAGTLKRAPDGVTIRFDVADTKDRVPATFTGVPPDLFREGSGVVAEGAFRADGVFVASNLLAKHDERYMPREMAGMTYDARTHQVVPAK